MTMEKLLKALKGNETVQKIVPLELRPSLPRFILKESLSPSALVAGLKTENGHVVVDRTMATNLKGLFAAGDCTGRPYQYAKAVGEGNVAAHAVSEYLK